MNEDEKERRTFASAASSRMLQLAKVDADLFAASDRELARSYALLRRSSERVGPDDAVADPDPELHADTPPGE